VKVGTVDITVAKKKAAKGKKRILIDISEASTA
jgi:hypothetical protein